MEGGVTFLGGARSPCVLGEGLFSEHLDFTHIWISRFEFLAFLNIWNSRRFPPKISPYCHLNFTHTHARTRIGVFMVFVSECGCRVETLEYKSQFSKTRIPGRGTVHSQITNHNSLLHLFTIKLWLFELFWLFVLFFPLLDVCVCVLL